MIGYIITAIVALTIGFVWGALVTALNRNTSDKRELESVLLRAKVRGMTHLTDSEREEALKLLGVEK